MFNKKTIALLEREIDKADGKIKELERGIEFRDGQIKRLVKMTANQGTQILHLEEENKKLRAMYAESERVRQRLAGRDKQHEEAAASYITVTVPRGGNNGT